MIQLQKILLTTTQGKTDPISKSVLITLESSLHFTVENTKKQRLKH